jgi:nitroimidazol reductase NimA-like FMN-containing flavoprotein (pyridoxamine 5'-phosphate oxidase superfamily)
MLEQHACLYVVCCSWRPIFRLRDTAVPIFARVFKGYCFRSLIGPVFGPTHRDRISKSPCFLADYQDGTLGRESIMRIISISEQECCELLKRVSIGRLACSLDGQPYVVPIAYSYESDSIYCFSTRGQKIEWMRQNPKVCLQVDEIGNHSNWSSAIVTGTRCTKPTNRSQAPRVKASPRTQRMTRNKQSDSGPSLSHRALFYRWKEMQRTEPKF